MGKLALTGFLVFLAPGTAAQVLFSLIMCFFAMRVYSDRHPFTSPRMDKFNIAAQLQLYFTLLGALAIKVNLDNENLQNKGYFDLVLTCVQFVPVLISLLTNLAKAENATKATGLLKSFSINEGGLEMGDMRDITLNPVPENSGDRG